MENPAENKQPKTLTDLLRKVFANVLDPIGGFFNRLGITPNTMTLIGLAGNMAAAYLLARGWITWGGVVVLLMGPIDAIDGAMARQRGKVTRFGGFLDSVIDRYSELFIFGGLLIFYLQQNNDLAVVLTYLAAAGSILISYTRARGESAGYPIKSGLLTRVERYIILVPFLIFNLPLVALWVLAILANFTAVQRIFIVRAKAKAENDVI